MEVRPIDFLEHLNRYVVGQEEVKKLLSIVGYSHYLRTYKDSCEVEMPNPVRFIPLICGPTGTGKTSLVKTLADYMRLPFIHIDATSLGMGGSWYGDSLAKIISESLNKIKDTDEWLYREYTIVFIDEFDKVIECNPSSSGINVNETIQNNMLVNFEGAVIDNNDNKLNTSSMLFILGGSFTKVVNNLKEVKNIGFKAELNDGSRVPNVTNEDLIKAGMVPELLGRIGPIGTTRKLTKVQIRDALTMVDNNILDGFKSLFYLSGKGFSNKNLDMDAVVNAIYDNEFGMRYAKTIIYDELKDSIFELSLHVPEPIEEPVKEDKVEVDASLVLGI